MAAEVYEPPGSARLELVSGVALLREEDAVMDAMEYSPRPRRALPKDRYVQLNIMPPMSSAGLCAALACRAW